jgi:hypothetical protein
MALLVRDTTIVTPVLRDGGSVLSAFALSGALTRFTETLNVGTFVEAIVFIQTTAHGGTNPTLDCDVQISPDGKNFVDVADSFTQITTTDGLFFKKVSANFGKYMRLKLKVAGTATPNYTLSVWIALKG